jgi:hypothetical protein
MALALDPQRIEMGFPAGDACDRRRGLRLKALQRCLGQPLLVQVGQRMLIEGIGDVPGMEQLQEVDPALAAGAGKPGEPVVADLRHIAIVALVARPGVIHADVAAERKPGDQHLVLFRQKRVVGTAEQGVDLPGGDVDAPLAQLLVQQWLGDMAVVMLIEQVAAQFRAEVPAVEACR